MTCSAFDRLQWKKPSRLRTFRGPPVEPDNATKLSRLAAALEVHHEPQFEGTPREETIMLLRAAAEIEQQLMVQYLYTAWSLSSGASQYDGEPVVTRYYIVRFVTADTLFSRRLRLIAAGEANYPTSTPTPRKNELPEHTTNSLRWRIFLRPFDGK